MRFFCSSICLTALLTLTGFANYSTTCCCGDSLLLEWLHGCCGVHEHQEHGPGPVTPEGPVHACYKAGQVAWTQPDADDELVGLDRALALGLPVERGRPPAAFAQASRAGGPPDFRALDRIGVSPRLRL